MKFLLPSFLLLVLVMASCDVSEPDPPPEKPPPELTGKLVFAADDTNENRQIYTMNADGSNLKQITHGTTASYNPSWGPDGEKIIYTSDKFIIYDVGSAIMVMNDDGSDQRFLYDPNPNDDGPPYPVLGGYARWSSDGSKVAFQKFAMGNGGHDIYVFDTATKQTTRLTTSPYADTSPRWSPNGRQILFYSERDYPDKQGQDIYIMNTDGSSITRLTEVGNVSDAIWSTSEKVAYLEYDSNVSDPPSKRI